MSTAGQSGGAGPVSMAGQSGAAGTPGAAGATGDAAATGAAGTPGVAGAGAAGGGVTDGGRGDAAASGPDAGVDAANTFTDPFDTFGASIWSCEYHCPTATGGAARFTLAAGAAPDTNGSWSKIRYKPRRFTSGRFTVRFSLTARPKEAVWWGVALWDDGPAADGSQFNEINFGYTTDESQPSTGLRFESSKHGKGVSLKVDTGVDLYDGQFHVGVLEYDATHVSFYFDGKLLQTITDTSVIPTDPMDFLIGPRLVTGAPSLPADFTESADSTEIDW
jgi:beta-glucanase (GH16 family)